MEYKKYGASGVESFDAKARRSVVEFSVQRCKEYVATFNHHDVDTDTDHIWEHQWDQFLTDFYLVCHENCKIQVSSRLRDFKLKRSDQMLLFSRRRIRKTV